MMAQKFATGVLEMRTRDHVFDIFTSGPKMPAFQMPKSNGVTKKVVLRILVQHRESMCSDDHSVSGRRFTCTAGAVEIAKVGTKAGMKEGTKERTKERHDSEDHGHMH